MKERVFDNTVRLKNNAMLKHRPELFYEWNFKKNDELGLDIYKMTKASTKIAWWKCTTCGSPYDRSIEKEFASKYCPYCSGKRINHTNSLSALRPDLSKEWHLKLNGELTPHNVTVGNSSGKKWWLCPNCKSSYDMTISNRTLKGQNCPYCSNQRLNHTNSLSAKRPDLAEEWHPTLNGELTPHDVFSSEKTIVWWLSKECGHYWDASTANRSKTKGCPYCAISNARLLVGFNDIWTTNPELASLLLNPEDGYRYMQMSSKKLDWKCRECEATIKNKTISDMNIYGLSCPKCSDGVKFPEKFMYNLLKGINIDFEFDCAQKWSGKSRYDFYFTFKEELYIIETHGLQHFDENGFSSVGGRALEEEQENDRLKEKLARESGIANYIVIDCRYSTIEWIKNSILNSDIMNIIGDIEIDFERIGQLASSSLVKTACDLWKSGDYSSALQISYKMNIHPGTIVDYLKRGAEIGWCDYSSKIKRDVVQLNENMEFMKLWTSLAEAERNTGIDARRISDTCRDKKVNSGIFKWMYKEDYDKLISNQKEIS